MLPNEEILENAYNKALFSLIDTFFLNYIIGDKEALAHFQNGLQKIKEAKQCLKNALE